MRPLSLAKRNVKPPAHYAQRAIASSFIEKKVTVRTQRSLMHAGLATDENSLDKKADHATPTSLTYSLPLHVFVCQTQDCVVFLDARRDRYVGVGDPDAQALRAVLAHTSSRNVGPAAQTSSQIEQVLDGLAARGLLTLDSRSSRPFRQVDLQPGSCAVGLGSEYEHAPRLMHVLAALIACVGARLDLRFRGIGGTLARLIAEKQKYAGRASMASADELRRLVSIFRVIRPFMYSKKDQCLFHGLALYRFLRYYGFSPTWVIGVSTAPFSAHCWVQFDECVLDDSPEQTLEFTPIAAI